MRPPLLKTIPCSGEALPAIGLGTWQTFDVSGAVARAERAPLLKEFFALGGRLVDSSPMYGQAEAAVGACREALRDTPPLFSATKVWTSGKAAGIGQMERSLELWGLERFDLMQIHNLVDWRTHLATLRDWKARGRVRYIGITTSHGLRHDETQRIVERERDVDFVQVSYNIADRAVEQRLLPACAAHGKAVLINLPFGTGGLFGAVAGKPLPASATDSGCASWAQFFLKFVISHPAVTCAIPATSDLAHLRDDLAALHGPVPDAAQRARMVTEFERLA